MGNKSVKAAVIGAGAAGTLAAYELQKRLGDQASITVYERNHRAGGRAWDVDFAGNTIEIGGVLLHSSGKHTMELMEYTGLNECQPGVSVDGDSETYAFWTKEGFPVFTKTSLLSMALGIVKYTGPISALRLTNAAKSMAANWESIYEHQANGELFTTVEDMLGAMGLYEPTTYSLGEFMKSRKINDRLAKGVVESIVHNMYNQGLEMNAFAGLVGLAGAGLAGGYLFAIEGGNWSLFQKTLEKMGVDLRLNTNVTAVEVIAADGEHQGANRSKQFVVRTSDGGEETFDLVILAAPPVLSNIQVTENGQPLDIKAHPYQQVRTTFVVGELDPGFFGADPAKELPSTVFTSDEAGAPFKSIGVTGFSPQYNQRIYKIFSADHTPTEEELNSIFKSRDDILWFNWPGAYPVLSPNIQHVPFQIEPGLYFANALETAAGSIEVEAVSGVNAGGLAAEYAKTLQEE